MLLTLHTIAVVLLFGLAAITAFTVTYVTAPYGRHTREGWGPTMPTRLGWIVMESPSAWFFAIVFMATVGKPHPAGVLLFAMWLYHYVYRAFVYPQRMRVGPNARMPVVVAAMAFAFNLLNSSINAPIASGAVATWPDGWLWDPRFLAGTALFVAGHLIHRHADRVLFTLRDNDPPGTRRYHIPRGGLYRYISCPNYFGELVQWSGWALATWSWGGLGFAVYTAANLVPRALDHHRWYQRTFADYPQERRAILPGIL